MTEVQVSITVNGVSRTQRVDTRMPLLDPLRERDRSSHPEPAHHPAKLLERSDCQ